MINDEEYLKLAKMNRNRVERFQIKEKQEREKYFTEDDELSEDEVETGLAAFFD